MALKGRCVLCAVGALALGFMAGCANPDSSPGQKAKAGEPVAVPGPSGTASEELARAFVGEWRIDAERTVEYNQRHRVPEKDPLPPPTLEEVRLHYDTFVIVAREDGRYEMMLGGFVAEGRYWSEDGWVRLQDHDDVRQANIKRDGSLLVGLFPGPPWLVLRPAPALAPIEPFAVIGEWKGKGDRGQGGITLAADGTGAIRSSVHPKTDPTPINWRIDKGRVYITTKLGRRGDQEFSLTQAYELRDGRLVADLPEGKFMEWEKK